MISRLEEAILEVMDHSEGTPIEIHKAIVGARLASTTIGTVYVAIDRLYSNDLVTRVKGPVRSERGGRAQYHYRPTAAGLAALNEVRELRSALDSFAPERPRRATPKKTSLLRSDP
jgi:DNA-binding PadR family transcriptional regulator